MKARDQDNEENQSNGEVSLPAVSANTLARCLGVTPKIIYDLTKEGVIERGSRAGRADHVVPCVEQQRHQPPSNRACCSGQENFHVNHSTWDLPCQNLGCDNKRSNKRATELAQIGFIKSSAVAFLGAM